MLGCSGKGRPSRDSADTATSAASQASAASGKGGAQLWAENCSRCHWVRPPQSFSDSQWEIIVHHMRLRANLTGPEAKAIADFLKASD